MLLTLLASATSATPFVAIFSIFVLAIFVGYYVVWGGNTCTSYPTHGGDQCLIQYRHRRCHAADRQHRWQYVYPNQLIGGICGVFS